MSKYELLPLQLKHLGIIDQRDIFEPKPVTEEVIQLTHDRGYWDKLRHGRLTRDEIRRTGFPYSKDLVNREVHIMGGTLACALLALEEGVSMNIAGGTHHAFTDRGEGFCLLNDIAIAANYLLHYQKVERILVVDLDVHQGNGTAEIFSKDSRVFTFSMHGANNYPMRKERSDLDVGLEDNIGDDEYLKELTEKIHEVVNLHQPEFVFYQSGVDVLETDKLGRLSMTLQGCRTRDRVVFELFSSLSVPIVASMGGGYSPTLATIVEAHAQTFQEAISAYF